MLTNYVYSTDHQELYVKGLFRQDSEQQEERVEHFHKQTFISKQADEKLHSVSQKSRMHDQMHDQTMVVSCFRHMKSVFMLQENLTTILAEIVALWVSMSVGPYQVTML